MVASIVVSTLSFGTKGLQFESQCPFLITLILQLLTLFKMKIGNFTKICNHYLIIPTKKTEKLISDHFQISKKVFWAWSSQQNMRKNCLNSRQIFRLQKLLTNISNL
jgi:hypothetical protein